MEVAVEMEMKCLDIRPPADCLRLWLKSDGRCCPAIGRSPLKMEERTC